jgi:cardiolipin synthase
MGDGFHPRLFMTETASDSARPSLLSRLRAFYRRRRRRIISGFVAVAHTAGALTSVEAIMETRTSQGAVAWALSLNLFPYGAVPAYWIFGHTEMEGYVVARRSSAAKFQEVGARLKSSLEEGDLRSEIGKPMGRMLEALAGLSFTRGNDVELLIDGERAFESMFQAIDGAQSYILVQFYIVRDDELGRKLKDKLIAKARAGVKVCFIYDELGSLKLGDAYVRELSDAGVRITSFSTGQRDGRKFQLNFRNHRKILVVDGKTGFTGGFNLGDEYVGSHPTLGKWRDTQIRVSGPAATMLQVPFGEDWFWATGEVLNDLDWEARESATGGDAVTLCLPTGPADPLESCALFFLAVINSAEKRLWIASPYFVPDEAIIAALQLASLRGVDVRLLIPEQPDSKLVYYSSYSYLEDVKGTGIKIYRYQKGFMHQKVVLMDDDFASVGSANFDNRSFRLNFEITMAVKDRPFVNDVASMLQQDFDNSRLMTPDDLDKKSFPFRFSSRVSRLLAPVQ